MEILSKNPPETVQLAVNLALKLRPKTATATVIGLYGDLGAGKTTFSQGLAGALGVTESVTSPTFVIEKIYKLPTGSFFTHLIHIDCYRLEASNELATLGFKDVLNNPSNLIIIEWPDRVAEIIPADHQRIFFEFIDEHTRRISYV